LAVEYTKNIYERQEIIGAIGARYVKAQATQMDRTAALNKVKIPSLGSTWGRRLLD